MFNNDCGCDRGGRQWTGRPRWYNEGYGPGFTPPGYQGDPRASAGFQGVLPEELSMDPDDGGNLIRAKSAVQAYFDVARVAIKAARQFPSAKRVAAKWQLLAGSKYKKAAVEELQVLTGRWQPVGAVWKFVTRKVPGGKLVLSPRMQERIAKSMAEVYLKGARELDEAGAGEWGGVLRDAALDMGGVAERAEESSVKEGLKAALAEAQRRTKVGFKIGVPVVAVLALVGGYLYMTALKK